MRITGQDIREAMSDYRVSGFLWFGHVERKWGWWIQPKGKKRIDSYYLGASARQAVDTIKE